MFKAQTYKKRISSPLSVSYFYRMIMTITFYRKFEYSLLSLLNHNDNNALKFKCQMLTLQILSSLCDLKWLFRCHRQTIFFKISNFISPQLQTWFLITMNMTYKIAISEPNTHSDKFEFQN